MKTAGWFMPLVVLPDIIKEPGKYVTRRGETVTILHPSDRHNFGCIGIYTDGMFEGWHKSGRLYFGQESGNDIIAKYVPA